ncbi:GTP 3',8-cyclase MoaA [Serinibacter arcticus]|uniref:GTP 3',8-cyclase n=1 Tax=Serinibacter arcticus TaxID=1655435 RepID=A0A4Z1E2P6_9MICO|nr:GTP 3',8-cyclase MoaA [Serinibacter arcticus]TGO05268.1 Molybdenum cofactor biosynthesis protein MoaA [Serinibacter arcticus]
MTGVPVSIGRRPPQERWSGVVPAGSPGALGNPGDPLVDTFGRVHRDLRISLTDRCSLRCTYCMPEQGMEWLSRSSVLTTDEIVRIASICADAGITTFRLTGGEPLLRKDLPDVVARLAALRGPEGTPVQIAMTTNGIGLDRALPELMAAGLQRLNISLDTVRRDRFAELTRRDRLDDVLAGIAAAQASGLRPLKINAVAMRGVNDDELVDLVEFAVAHDAQMRFIEQMPLDAGHTWDRAEMVTREEILDALAGRWNLTPVPGRGGAPAERWRLGESEHTVGVIASVTAPFCGDCDRMRLTADGQLRNCLFSNAEFDLLPLLRGDDPARIDGDVDAMLRAAIHAKLPGHAINDPGFLQPARGMNAIGG